MKNVANTGGGPRTRVGALESLVEGLETLGRGPETLNSWCLLACCATSLPRVAAIRLRWHAGSSKINALRPVACLGRASFGNLTSRTPSRPRTPAGVLHWAGRLLALFENGLPYEMVSAVIIVTLLISAHVTDVPPRPCVLRRALQQPTAPSDHHCADVTPRTPTPWIRWARRGWGAPSTPRPWGRTTASFRTRPPGRGGTAMAAAPHSRAGAMRPEAAFCTRCAQRRSAAP